MLHYTKQVYDYESIPGSFHLTALYKHVAEEEKIAFFVFIPIIQSFASIHEVGCIKELLKVYSKLIN